MNRMLLAGHTIMAAVLLGGAAASSAQTFDLVSQQREADVRWEMATISGMGPAEDSDIPSSNLSNEAGPLETFVGNLSPNTRSSFDGLATANSLANVTTRSFIGSESISFDALARTGASGSATPPARYFAEGNAQSVLRAAFDIAAPTVLDLRWSADLAGRFGQSQFGILRDGTRLLGESVAGVATRDVHLIFTLDPGRYDLFVFVGDSSGSFSDSGSVPMESSAAASFALQPVPEPQTWLLMAIGLALVGGAAKRGRGALASG